MYDVLQPYCVLATLNRMEPILLDPVYLFIAVDTIFVFPFFI